MAKKRFTFNVNFNRKWNLTVGRCLELGIVATGKDIEEAKSNMGDLLVIQVRYALENDNMEYLYQPAPKDKKGNVIFIILLP